MLWSWLGRDPATRWAGAAMAILAAPYLVPWFSLGHREWVGHNIFFSLLIVLTLLVLRWGIGRLESVERAFWNLWSGAYFLWLLAELWSVLIPSEQSLTLSASRDFLYFGFYALIAWAIATRPHERRRASAGQTLRLFEPAGGSVLALGLFAYLVAIPAVFDQPAYLNFTSMLLFLTVLDGFFTLRLLALRSKCPSPRWRAIYGGLIAMTLSWMALDGREYLGESGFLEPSRDGSLADLLWLLPFAAVVFAARVRDYPWPRLEEPIGETDRRSESVLPFGLDPSPLLAVAFLIVHFSIALFVDQDPRARVARDVCALVVLLLLAALGLLRMSLLRSAQRRSEGLRRVAEHRSRRLEEELTEAQRLEAIGVLAGGIAHDFNNLMTAVKGHAELALERPTLNGGVREDLGAISLAAERATELTRELLAFTRQQVLRPQVTDVNVVVLGVESLLRSSLGEDRELALDLDPEIGHVHVDPAQLERVFLNLTVNARDAMPGGGRLTLTTANTLLSEAVEGASGRIEAGRYCVISVGDTGVGMDEEVQHRAFEPFFSTKGRTEGAGLGLAVAHGIVRQSGGYISLESVPGEGTVFWIYLPRVGREPGQAAREPTGSEDVRGSETVLLVEDDERVRQLVQRALETQGYRVLAAGQAAEALELWDDASSVDLLVTDVVLPGLSGPDLAKRRPWPRVLYISGYADDKLRSKGLDDPEVPFLQKPFGPRELVETVRQVLDSQATPPT